MGRGGGRQINMRCEGFRLVGWASIKPLALPGGALLMSPTDRSHLTNLACTRRALARRRTHGRVGAGPALVLGLVGVQAVRLVSGPAAGRRYIDPGSGSFAIQIIIAAVLGGLLTARLWLRHAWWRLIGRWRSTKTDQGSSTKETDR